MSQWLFQILPVLYLRRSYLEGRDKREAMRRRQQWLSKQLGLNYVEIGPHELVDGTLRKAVELASGKFALIEKSREFTLVPWRPVLEHHIGEQCKR